MKSRLNKYRRMLSVFKQVYPLVGKKNRVIDVTEEISNKLSQIDAAKYHEKDHENV